MARETTVYRVAALGNMIRHYHFPTKRAAMAFIREEMADPDHDPDWGEPEIDVVTVTLNAAGVAEALNDFISMTCVNEG